MKDIYRKIAEQNGVTAEEVEKEINEAIASADSELMRDFRAANGREITAEELILLCASGIQKE